MTQEVKIITENENYVEAVNSVKEQEIVSSIRLEMEVAQRMLIQTAINIGRQLTEAKEFIKHGEWENWLKERVNFSQRTANNFMKVYKEYGNDKINNSDVITSLNYSQAVELLAVPSDDREEFAKEVNAKDMTIKELRENIKAIKEEKDSADSQLKKIEAEKESLVKENSNKQKDLDSLSERVSQLRKEKQEATQNQDKALEEKIAKAIEKEQKKITTLEEEKKSLAEKITALQNSQKEAITQAKEAEQKKAEKLLEKKNKELESATNRFKSQIEKIKEQNKAEKEKVKEAEGKAKLSKELIKCDVLLANIEADYEELTLIIKRVNRTYPEHVTEIEKALGDVLKAMEKRAKIHIAS
ncbi:MAG: DUF3102 domain-containing protein [Clostridiales bacterium]|nr:DUF3102 domain-containing protein [Clostridiales bacterium]